MKQKIITIFILCMCILGLTITQSININEASISTKILKLWQAQSPSILNVRQQAAFVGKIIYQLTVSILKFLKNNEKNDTDHIIGFPVNQL